MEKLVSMERVEKEVLVVEEVLHTLGLPQILSTTLTLMEIVRVDLLLNIIVILVVLMALQGPEAEMVEGYASQAKREKMVSMSLLWNMHKVQLDTVTSMICK